MSRINYVLCTWSGPRRVNDPRVDRDPAYYLRQHVHSLVHLPHNLDQITVMVPENPKEPAAFRRYLERELPQKIQFANVEVIERPNVGMSYGSLSDCYVKYRTEFDFYMFMEDDYVFTQPYFDALHLEVMQQNPDCGYLCGLAWATPPPLHAGIANGMMRTKALEAIFVATDGWIPHARDGQSYNLNERHGQIGQSQAFIAMGYKLLDWKDRFRVRFREGEVIREFHRDQFDLLMEPI